MLIKVREQLKKILGSNAVGIVALAFLCVLVYEETYLYVPIWVGGELFDNIQ